MQLFKMPKAGPGFVILNVVRVMNIIGLMECVAASWVMLVKTFIVSKFFFFDACSHLITSTISIFLIVSELPLWKGYFAKNWPLLSPSHGFCTLGTAMIVVGVSILGNLNKQATSQSSLGMPFWRIVISSGIVILILGFLNIVLSFVFSDRKVGVTARQVRSYGATAPIKNALHVRTGSSSTHARSPSNFSPTSLKTPKSPFYKRATFSLSAFQFHKSNSPTKATSPTNTKPIISISAPTNPLPIHKAHATTTNTAPEHPDSPTSIYTTNTQGIPHNAPPYPLSRSNTLPSYYAKSEYDHPLVDPTEPVPKIPKEYSIADEEAGVRKPGAPAAVYKGVFGRMV